MSDQAKQAPREIELWSKFGGGFRVFRLEGMEALGIEVGGMTAIRPLTEWHALAFIAGFESITDSETPRTDKVDIGHGEMIATYQEMLMHARQLERELAASEDRYQSAVHGRSEFRKALKEARAKKESE